MRWLLGAIALVAIAGLGCSTKNKCSPRVVSADQKCSTTKDCVDAGYKGLACVNQKCALPCLSDTDCSLSDLDEQESDTCKDQTGGPKPTFICEAELCTRGCPDVACGSGETCVHGRCAKFFESFELASGQDLVTPRLLGWNDLGFELENKKTQIVFAGDASCSRGDERCAGPAAEGVRFLSLERVPTPPLGTPTIGVTCHACACCLQCQFTPTSTVTPDLARCPDPQLESSEMICPAQPPTRCRSVCSQCDACIASGVDPKDDLLACEKQPARKTCSGCAPYEACLTRERAAHRCENAQDTCYRPTTGECTECILALCAALRAPCFACRDAIQCERDMPGAAACVQSRQQCNAQGADGCYATAIERKRSALDEKEQALTSKAINLSGQTGRLVIQLEYVPFDIGDQYRRVIQMVPRSAWPNEKQEVLVQLCGGACEMASSWVDAKLSNGQVASLPPANQRKNGLHLGDQSLIDWRGNRVEIEVPENLRTAAFRMRFVPRLEDQARFGIDNILIRRLP